MTTQTKSLQLIVVYSALYVTVQCMALGSRSLEIFTFFFLVATIENLLKSTRPNPSEFQSCSNAIKLVGPI